MHFKGGLEVIVLLIFFSETCRYRPLIFFFFFFFGDYIEVCSVRYLGVKNRPLLNHNPNRIGIKR